MSVRVWTLDQPAAIERLTDWAARLGADPDVCAVVLFGSLARGEATAASDADVLVLLRASPLGFRERLVRYKPTGLGISVEVFPYTLAEARRAVEEGGGVVPVALREGRTLFGPPRPEALLHDPAPAGRAGDPSRP